MTYYEGSEPYVFLNYAPDDAPTIAPLVELLFEYDFRVWSEMGDGFGLGQVDHIADRLERAHCCICVLTQGFVGSFGCREKMKWALTKNVPMIVICMEDVKLPWGSRLRLWFAKILHDVQYMTPTAFTKMLCNCDLLNACRMTPPTDTIPQSATVSSCVSSSASVDQGLSCSSSARYSTGLAFRKLDDGTYEVAGKGLCKDTELVIPPTTPDGGKVVHIAAEAFRDKDLRSVSIPEGVTSIEAHAFQSCSSLRSVSLPSSLLSIGSLAFLGCGNMTEIVIPPQVKTIGDYAFSCCYGLTKVVISDSVTQLGRNAFMYCSSLKTIEVDPKNPSYYSQGNCVIERKTPKLIVGIQTSQIPSGVLAIGENSFRGQRGLKRIAIPTSVTRIEDEAFYGCDALTQIEIPENVDYIASTAFNSCKKLKKIDVEPANFRYYSKGDCVIERETKKLVIGIRTSVIPSNVRVIGKNAFRGCGDLTSIVIPRGVTSIEHSAFEFCSSLTKITIPDTVISIEAEAFRSCISLKKAIIPKSVEKMGKDAFADCNNVTIYCEHPYHPGNWSPEWNSGDRPVVWNYKPE